MADVKKIATRESYGKALAELGQEHENLSSPTQRNLQERFL